MRAGGFTLVELMVVLAVLAILTTVVVPSMRSMYLQETSTTQTLDFVASLNYTRNEAIKRGAPVIMCKSDDGATCNSDSNWQQGWIVFADTNNNGSLNTTDEILRVHGPLTDTNATLHGNDLVTNKVTYNANGTSQNGAFLLCDIRGLASAKAIVLSSGRIRTLKQTDPTAPDSVANATSCDFST